MKLRPYQEKAISNIIAGYSNKKLSQLLVLPTGAGKTIIFSNVIKILNKKTLIISNRDNLKNQIREVCDSVCPNLVTSCTIQMVHRNENLEKIKNAGFEFLIIDEAHHAASISYEELINYFKKEKKPILGCTATPFRLDNKSVYKIFKNVPYESTIIDLIDDGYLTDIKGLRIKTDIDIDSVHVSRGEFKLNQLSKLVNIKYRNELICDFYKKFLLSKKTIAFCVDIKHCEELKKEFICHGIGCKAVHGKLSGTTNKKTLMEFKNGDVGIITTCQLLTEGFDEPSIESVIMARPTKSCGLYIQMIGRGLRTFPGKKECIIAEFTDNCHNICDFSTLVSCKRSDNSSILKTEKVYSIKDLSKIYEYIPQGNEIVISEEDFLNRYRKDGCMSEFQREQLASFGIKYIEPLSFEIADILIKQHKAKEIYGIYRKKKK